MSDLTNLANVKEYLRIKTNKPDDDLLLSRLITSCSSLVENFLGFKVLASTYIETFNGNNSSSFFCSNSPIISVTNFGVNGSTVNNDIVFDKDFIYNYNGFSRGFRNCTVTYVAGYLTTPPDIEQACIELVAFKYKGIEHIDKTSIAMAGETTSFITAGIPESVKSALNQYRKVTLN